jgi:hypothetical protein
VLLHLRARMPDRRAAARKPVFVAGHGGWETEASILHAANSAREFASPKEKVRTVTCGRGKKTAAEAAVCLANA